MEGNIDLYAQHASKRLVMTLRSGKVKKGDKAGAGPQKLAAFILEMHTSSRLHLLKQLMHAIMLHTVARLV